MEQRPKKLLPKVLIGDRVRETIRRKHYSNRTEESYVVLIKRHILFHNKRHPLGMANAEIEAFLPHVVIKKRMLASSQNQGSTLKCLNKAKVLTGTG